MESAPQDFRGPATGVAEQIPNSAELESASVEFEGADGDRQRSGARWFATASSVSDGVDRQAEKADSIGSTSGAVERRTTGSEQPPASAAIIPAAEEARELPAVSDRGEYLSPLAGLAQLPLDEHADRFAQVHDRLQAALTQIDPSG